MTRRPSKADNNNIIAGWVTRSHYRQGAIKMWAICTVKFIICVDRILYCFTVIEIFVLACKNHNDNTIHCSMREFSYI